MTEVMLVNWSLHFITTIGDLLLCSLSHSSSQEDNTHFLKLLALNIIIQGKIEVCSNSDLIFGGPDLRK